MYYSKARDSKRHSCKRAIFLSGLLTLLLCFYNLSEALSADKAAFSKVYSERGIRVNGVETANSISFNVAVPDIGISEVKGEDGATYHKISIPDSAFLTKNEGAPQLPYISELIQLPANALNVSIRVSRKTDPKIYNGILVYPSSRKVVKTTSEGYEYIAEEFYIDPAHYNNNNAMPKVYAEITEDGYFRSIRMARINIYPLKYAASERVLEFASELTVTITWTAEPRNVTKKDTTKGFEKLISNLTLNSAAYMKIEQPDISAQERIKAESPAAATAGTGSVRYVTGAELKDIATNCDYLIITHQNFFSTPELANFVNYRATYSELNVVVAKTEDIYAQFPNGGGNDYSIRDFVQYAYSNWQTAPQYLLIVGDVEYVPSHPVPHVGPYMDYEEWYACVSGGDEWPDMAMGRFSIKNKDDIARIKNKIAAYEQDPVLPGDYHAKGLYVEGSAGHHQWVIDRLFNAGFEIPELYSLKGNTWNDFINAVNSGRNIVYWFGHGGPGGWEYGGYHNDISLLNNNNYPVILTCSCDTASLGTDVSIGENFVKISGKGAVAYYGATTVTLGSASDTVLIKTLDSYEYVLGKAILLAEIGLALQSAKENILLGDPALQTFGYKLNQGLPDPTVSSLGVNYSYLTQQLTLSVVNIGSTDASDVLTRAYIVDYATGGEYPFGEYSFPLIPAGGSAETTLAIPPPFKGEYLIVARVDPENRIAESCEVNNQNGRRLLISPTFVDITDGAGIDPGGNHTACAGADIDGDGYTDICLASNLGPDAKTQLYLNKGNGTFSDITTKAGIGSLASHKVVFGDINNDGFPDLYICRDGMSGQNRLFLNNGHATFEDITVQSGINGYGSLGAMFGDSDGDGDLDLFISSGKTSNSALFVNNGDSTFTNNTSASGLGGLGFCTISRFGDIDNDGDTDILVLVDFHLRFYLNDGRGCFTQDTPGIIGSKEINGFSLSDIDADADLDFLLLWEDELELFRNKGGGSFEKVEPYILQRISGWGDPGSTLFAEIDNVVGEDILWGKYLIRNSSGGLFENYESILYGDEICSFPVDIEGDGDNDLITASSSNTKVLRNQTDNHNWLKVKPVGVVSNRDATGAKVYVYSSGNTLVGFQEVSCEKPAPLHFGVDSGDTYRVVVRWPGSGATSTIAGVSSAQTITVVEQILPPPAAPSNLIALAVSQSQINLTWRDNSSDEDGFKIERGPDGVNFNQIATVGRDLIAYSDSPLIPGVTYYYRVRAYNIGGDSAYSNIASATTLPSNRPPVLEPIGDKVIDEGTLVEFTVKASDPDADPLTYSASKLPEGATFSAATKTFSWTPTYTQAGVYTITFTVSDGYLTDSETITITVKNTNRPPVIVAIDNKVAIDGEPLGFTVSAKDPDNDTLTLSATMGNGDALFTIGATFTDNGNGTGTFSWTPAASNPEGAYSILFTAKDPGGLSDSKTATITLYHKAKISYPAPGTRLRSSSATFSWAGASAGAKYKLLIGRQAGQNDIYNGPEVTVTSASVSGIPITGQPVYVTLNTMVAGLTGTEAYTYQTGAAARIVSPSAGTTLMSSQATFSWSGGIGVSEYSLKVGSSPGQGNIYSAEGLTGTSQKVTGIPMNGRTVYAQLGSKINGQWVYDSYFPYAAYRTAIFTPAQISAPANGSTLNTPNVRFFWSGGVGVDEYRLVVGRAVGGGDIYNQSLGVVTTAQVTGIPLTSGRVYVRLVSLSNGQSLFKDYVYQTVTSQPAQLTYPAAGTVLRYPNVSFAWSAGVGVSRYSLSVGTSFGASDIYRIETTSTSAPVSSIPLTGQTVYVRLGSLISGNWVYRDYTYSTLRALPAQITSPASGTRLTSAQVMFRWTPVAGAISYRLTVGTSAGGGNISNQYLPNNQPFASVSNIPLNGQTVYVRLWTQFGSITVYADYQYQTGMP